MTTSPAPEATSTRQGERPAVACYFLNKEHSKRFDDGLPALTLCGKWTKPQRDTGIKNMNQPTGKTIHCPRCMNIKFNGGL